MARHIARKKTPVRKVAVKARKATAKVPAAQSYTSLLYGIFTVFILFLLFIVGLQFFTPKNTPSKGVITQESAKTSQMSEQKKQQTLQRSTYTVQENDNLWKIAEILYQDGYKWVEIAKVNNLAEPGVITKGTVLELPNREITLIQNIPKASQASEQKIADKTYLIKPGDDLWNVALRAYGDGYKWVEIARANNLSDPNTIHSGNTLVIPRS